MRNKQSGMSLLEAMVASSITIMVLGTATAIWFSAASSWLRGSGRIDAETQSRKAVRTIAGELTEAMDVAVDGDGLGLTFHVAEKDEDGEYKTDALGQPLSDGVNRRIYLSGAKVIYSDGSGLRTLAKNVIKTDPLSANGATAYKIFTPGQGSITRQVTIMVATQTAAGKEKVTGRKREIVFLRNIYDTNR